MVKDLQEANAGGTTNAPLNANMRLFAAKFGWVNMGFLNPPPESMVNAIIPKDTSTPRRRRRMQKEAAANGTDLEECEVDDEECQQDTPKASDLPDPNESGNAGFLRKSGITADEFFIGQMMAIVLTPAGTAYFTPKVTDRVEAKRNMMRNMVLSKQAMALKHDQFADLGPAFDDVLTGMPEWKAPAKYQLSTVLLTILTVQNMAICQCSLMAIFEGRAVVTWIASVVSIILFPFGFIVYTFITLRGVMQPESKMPVWAGGAKYWTFAQTVLKSIPSNLGPGDIVWVPSIPPELLVKPKPLKPDIPPGTPPDKAKEIVKECVEQNKAMLKARIDGIKKLGPEALMIQGKWVVKTKPAEQFMSVYGQQFGQYNGMGFYLVALEQVKRLLQVIVLAALATAPVLGPLQVKMLTVIGGIEFAIVCYTRPHVDVKLGFSVMGTQGMKVSQMLGPFLLMFGLVEDQFTALSMMLMNALTSAVGVVKECAAAAMPLLQMARDSVGPAVAAVMKIFVAVGVIVGTIKKKLGKIERPKPPPPVWGLIKMPPPVVNLLAEMLPPPIMEKMKAVIAEVGPIMKAYGMVFSKFGAKWMGAAGIKELARQFKAILDPNNPQERINVTKYINKFHKMAILTVFQICQPKMKRAALQMYDDATAVATEVKARMGAASSGSDPIAAAMAILNPDIVGKLEGLFGDVIPVIKK
jgi:hypothetical protein